MENHIDLVNRGLTIKHHFGWQDLNHSGTTTTFPVADTWVELPNDGGGPQTNTEHKIYDHGNIWDTENNQFDFSSLKLGDLLLIRLSGVFTTSVSNVSVAGKFRVAVGSDIEYDLPFDQSFFKKSGTHLVSVNTFIYMGNEQTMQYPTKVYAMSDNDSTTLTVDGWAVATLARN